MAYQIQQLTPILETHDLAATISFYTTILGFQLEAFDEAAGWANVQHGNIAIMFSKPNEHIYHPKSVMSGSLYLYTTEVNKVWQQVKDHAQICYPIEDFDYGMREFGIFDNNGYLIKFGCELDQVDAEL